jgi:hypothetical protein
MRKSTDSKLFPGYLATSCGEILGPSGRVLRPSTTKKGLGYRQITATCGGIRKTYYVHRFVWEYFNGPIPKGLVIDHIDSDRFNNRLENLQVLSPRDNVRKGPKVKLTQNLAEEIRSFKGKLTGRVLAKEYGVSEATISEILNNLKWLH